MNAVDTNIFAYSVDAFEPVKQGQAQRLIEDLARSTSQSILLWQVAGEFLNCLRKWESAGKVPSTDVAAHFHDVVKLFPLRIPSAAIFDISFDLRSRFSLSHWDNMLLAGCKEAGVDTLFSEDMDDDTDYDGLKIVNPFS